MRFRDGRPAEAGALESVTKAKVPVKRSAARKERDFRNRHAACIGVSPVAPAPVGPGNGCSDVRRFRHDEETRVDCVWPDSAGSGGWSLGRAGAGLRSLRSSAPTSRTSRTSHFAAVSASTSASRLRRWVSPGSRVLSPARRRGPGHSRRSPFFDWDRASAGGPRASVLRPGE